MRTNLDLNDRLGVARLQVASTAKRGTVAAQVEGTLDDGAIVFLTFHTHGYLLGVGAEDVKSLDRLNGFVCR